MGPIVGALIIRNLSWAWVFWINVPLGIAAAAGYAAFLFAIPWEEVLDPRVQKSLGFEEPYTRLTLVPLQGEP